MKKAIFNIITLGKEWEKPRTKTDWFFILLPWITLFFSVTVCSPLAGLAAVHLIWG